MKSSKPQTYAEWIADAEKCIENHDNEGILLAYTEADRLQPKQPWLVQNITNLHYRLRHWQECIDLAEQLLGWGVNGNDAAGLYRIRGESLKHLGRIPAAAESWRMALESHPLPDYLEYFNHACGLALTGQNDLALQQLEIALMIQPEKAEKDREDTDFDALRGDPGFDAVFGRVDQGDTHERITWHLRSPARRLRVMGVTKAGFCVAAFGAPNEEWPALIVKISHEDYLEQTAGGFVTYVWYVHAGGHENHLLLIASALTDYWASIGTKQELEAIGQGLRSIAMALKRFLLPYRDDLDRALSRLLGIAAAPDPGPEVDLEVAIHWLTRMQEELSATA